MSRLIQILTAALMGVLLSAYPSFAQTPVPAEREDHAQLRSILESVRESINAGEFEDVIAHFHSTFAATMIDQTLLTKPEDVKSYFEKWFKGEDAVIKKLTINPEADEKTIIFDGKYGLVYGSNKEIYEIAIGNTYEINSRWTAMLIKDGGKWKLLSIHNGVNFMDNPVLSAAEGSTLYFGIGGVVVGILLTLMVAWIRRRLTRRSVMS